MLSYVISTIVVFIQFVKVLNNFEFILIGVFETSSSIAIEYLIYKLYNNQHIIYVSITLIKTNFKNQVLINDFQICFRQIIIQNTMRSFGESSNLEVQGYRRHGNKGIINRTEPSILANETSSFDKSSSKSTNQTQRLYVKEFFDHFFEKKSMLEIITQIGNAFHVLQTLVTNFQNEKGIISDTKMPFQSKAISNGNFPNIIQKQGNQISEAVEDLYHRLEEIFQRFGNQQMQIQASRKSFHVNEENGDEELYEMLNDYKNDNKKQKQLKKKAQNQCIQLRKQIAKIEEEKLKITQLYKESQYQLISLKKRNSDMESKLEEITEEMNIHISEKNQISQKLSLLFQINENLSMVEPQNEQLNKKIKQSQERQALLTKKFDNLEAIIQKRIKQNDKKWLVMIQQKLTSKILFENAACSSFRQFMGSIQTLNKC